MQRETRWAFNQHMFKIVHTPYENGKCKKSYRYIKFLCSDYSHDSNNDLPSTGDSAFPSITSIELQPNGITR